MNNYCGNCGHPLEKEVLTCPKCGLNLKNLEVKKSMKNEEVTPNSDGKKIFLILSIIWIIAMGLSLFVKNNFVAIIRPLLYILALAILVYGKITMKDSRIINALFYIFCSIAIVYLLFCIAIIWFCTNVAGQLGV